MTESRRLTEGERERERHRNIYNFTKCTILHYSETHTSNITIKKHKNEIHSENEAARATSPTQQSTMYRLTRCQRWMVNVVSEIALRFSHFVMVIGFFIFLFFYCRNSILCGCQFLMPPFILTLFWVICFGCCLASVSVNCAFRFYFGEKFHFVCCKAACPSEPDDVRTQIRYTIRTFPTSTSLFSIKICWFFFCCFPFRSSMMDTNDSRIENCTAIL